MEQALLNEMRELAKAEGLAGDFRPFAYYDKHLDCIRVQLFDCSFTEKRLNRFVTVLNANHEAEERLAGFNIKGVRHLFEQLGLSATAVHRMTAVIDSLAKFYPDSVLEQVKRHFRPVLDEEQLEVSLA